MKRHPPRIELTPGGDWEVHAPEGWNYGGRHSIVVRGSYRMAQRERADHMADLERCPKDCDCSVEDGQP